MMSILVRELASTYRIFRSVRIDSTAFDNTSCDKSELAARVMLGLNDFCVVVRGPNWLYDFPPLHIVLI